MKDKTKHLIAGFVINLLMFSYTALILLLFGAYGLGVCITFGLSAAIIAGASKELLDKLGSGTPDVWDFVATVMGGLVATCLILLITGV